MKKFILALALVCFASVGMAQVKYTYQHRGGKYMKCEEISRQAYQDATKVSLEDEVKKLEATLSVKKAKLAEEKAKEGK